MKKGLSILGTIGLTATSTTSLISCEKPKSDNNNENGGNKPEPQQPPENSNGKMLIEGKNEEINNTLKIYIGLNLIGKTGFVNTGKGKQLKPDTGKIFGYKSIYRWDGIGEPEKPTVNPNTGKITDGKG